MSRVAVAKGRFGGPMPNSRALTQPYQESADMGKTIAVLFCRADSVYKSLPGVDAWDEQRDARRWPGGTPCVAHPPCRAWSRLRHFARPAPGERELALWAVDQVRFFGGVLEHPVGSSLWSAAGLPPPGKRDQFGGWTLPVDQNWWGHRARKATLLYVVGCDPRDIPPVPLVLGEATHVVQTKQGRPHISKAEREHTPVLFARWLVDLAVRCRGPADSSGGMGPQVPMQAREGAATRRVDAGGAPELCLW